MINLRLIIDRIEILEALHGTKLSQIDRELFDLLMSSRALRYVDQPSLEFIFDQLNQMIERKMAA